MKRSDYLIWLGITTAAGAAVGALTGTERPLRGGVLGAAAGMLTGAVVAGVYGYVTQGEEIPFYSSSSLQYEENDNTLLSA